MKEVSISPDEPNIPGQRAARKSETRKGELIRPEDEARRPDIHEGFRKTLKAAEDAGEKLTPLGADEESRGILDDFMKSLDKETKPTIDPASIRPLLRPLKQTRGNQGGNPEKK